MTQKTRSPRRPLSFALALAALPLALPSDVSTEKEFEEALQVVDRTIAGGKAKKGKELLLSTIEQSKDQPWALYHLKEILDDLKRSTFWSAQEKPDPKALVSGEILSWSAASGLIKVRYEPARKVPAARIRGTTGTGPLSYLADFTQVESALVHPLAFEGPYTIEVRGKSYPVFLEPARPPAIVVCAGWAGSMFVSFGLPPKRTSQSTTYVPARILQIEGGESTALAGGEGYVSFEALEPFEMKVVVSSTSVTAFCDGRKTMTAKKPEGMYGQFLLLNLPDKCEIVVTGKAQPSWIQGVVDAEMQERWSAFEKDYDPVSDLPAWLREKAWSTSGAPAAASDGLPAGADAAGAEKAKTFQVLLSGKDPQKALDFALALPMEGSAANLRAWFVALASYETGRVDEALEACTSVCAADARFLPARRMKVELQNILGNRAQAISECKAVVADFPGEHEPYVDLTELHLQDGHPEEARSTVRGAIDAGVPAGNLADAQHLVARAATGPLWSKPFEYRSEHYVVTSDIGQGVCFEAASLLEKFYAKFNIHLRRVPKGERRAFRVHIFSGKAGYEAYTKDLTGQEIKNTAGLYSSMFKQLLISNLPDAEQMMRTVRHEGFHQYLDRLVASPPRWLNEGLAEYYEGSKLVRGSWSDGEVRTDHLSTIEEEGLVSLKEFLVLPAGAFFDEKLAPLCYAQSWAFVHFLLNSGAEHKKRFDQLLDALIGGARPKAAVQAAFDEASLPKLEKEFSKYVAGLK